MRYDQSGFRANTTDAAWPAVECWIQPRASRSVSWQRNSKSSPSDSRLIGLVRGMGRLPFLDCTSRILRADKVYQNSWPQTSNQSTSLHSSRIGWNIFSSHISCSVLIEQVIDQKSEKMKTWNSGQIFKIQLKYFTVILCSTELHSEIFSLRTFFAWCSSSRSSRWCNGRHWHWHKNSLPDLQMGCPAQISACSNLWKHSANMGWVCHSEGACKVLEKALTGGWAQCPCFGWAYNFAVSAMNN